MPSIPRKIVYIIIIIAFIGFVDAAYLSIVHFLGTVPECSLLKGCEVVTTSRYSVIAGIPVALLGAIYYLTVFFLAIVYLKNQKETLAQGLRYLSWCGLLASAYFLFLQLFVLHAICLYCMLSILTSTLIWIFLRKKVSVFLSA